MRTIIAGSRSINLRKPVWDAVSASNFEISQVVSGCANGVDKLGEGWAFENCVKVARFPADWKTHGKKAGPLRNILMADNADALIAVWDGSSRGTKHMIDTAKAKGLKVYVHRVGGSST